ncbi:hypothetical protein [Sodalis sp.]
MGTCTFRDCRHDIDPACAIREAVESSAIAYEPSITAIVFSTA